MEKKIIFGKLNFNYIYFVLYIIIIFLSLEIKILNFTDKSEFEANDYLVYKILFLYMYNFSNLLVIIPILMMKNLNKNNENDKIDISSLNEVKQNHESSNLIYNDINDTEISKRKKIFLFYSFLAAIFDFLAKFIEILFYVVCDGNIFEPYVFSYSIPFDIILQFISSHFILKIYFYKFQYFALSINIIIFIVILTIDIINIIYYNSFRPIVFFFYSFSLIFILLSDAFGKKAILYGFISIYALMAFIGFFTFIFTIILSLIILIVNKELFVQLGFFSQK